MCVCDSLMSLDSWSLLIITIYLHNFIIIADVKCLHCSNQRLYDVENIAANQRDMLKSVFVRIAATMDYAHLFDKCGFSRLSSTLTNRIISVFVRIKTCVKMLKNRVKGVWILGEHFSCLVWSVCWFHYWFAFVQAIPHHVQSKNRSFIWNAIISAN